MQTRRAADHEPPQTIEQIAYRERDRREKQQLRWLGYLALYQTILVTMSIFISLFVIWQINDRAEESRRENALQAVASAKQQLQTTCHVEKAIRKMAKRFGALIPPSEECLGDDPVFLGTAGADTIRGSSHVDWINGRGGNDLLYGLGSSDTIIGSGGNDTLKGGFGEDWHYGGDGKDEIYAVGDDGKLDHIEAGAGRDKCVYRPPAVLKGCEKVEKVG